MAKKKILLVDDEVSFTWLLQLNLEDAGDYEVSVVNEPETALETARKILPDFIVLDIIMPGVDGIELALQFQKDEQLKDVPTVFLTATEFEPGGVLDNKLIHGNRVIAKPVSVDDVIEIIEGTVG